MTRNKARILVATKQSKQEHLFAFRRRIGTRDQRFYLAADRGTTVLRV